MGAAHALYLKVRNKVVVDSRSCAFDEGASIQRGDEPRILHESYMHGLYFMSTFIPPSGIVSQTVGSFCLSGSTRGIVDVQVLNRMLNQNIDSWL